MSNGAEASPVVDVEVTTHGDFPGIAEYAQTKIGGLARIVPRPILRARIRLTRSHDPAVELPVVAQGNLDVQGRLVRAQVEAGTAQEAVDKLESRLRRRLEHLAERWEAPRGPAAAPPWRAEGEPARAARPMARSTAEPRIIRRKSFAMAPCTVDEAVAEMELLDYDFHLFTESGSGAAGVVYRGGPTGYRVALVAPEVTDQVTPFQESVTISSHPAPCLREHDALERLALLGLPFLFFIDAAQGRASLLYRRYDGAYGVITPAA